MSDPAHGTSSAPAPASGHATHAGGHDGHSDMHYVKIWGVLLVLLVVSLVGPIIGEKSGIFAITLVTAFGIAVVKAYLVIKNFMHIGVEKRYVAYLLITMLGLMVLMVGGVGPDVLRHDGTRWTNVAAHKATEEGLKAGGGHGEHGDAPKHDEAAPPAEHH